MQTSSNLWGQSCLLGKRAPPGVLSSGSQYSVHCVRNCNAKTSQSSVLLSPPSLVENQGELSSKQTWRASIDFKWIRENKDAVAANIRNRKSAGDVELVVELYEQSVNLSQVRRSSSADALEAFILQFCDLNVLVILCGLFHVALTHAGDRQIEVGKECCG